MHEAKGAVASLKCDSDQTLTVKEKKEREGGRVQQIMWIIIPGQWLDERETLTHRLMQPGDQGIQWKQMEERETIRQGWMEGMRGENQTQSYIL